MSFVSTLAPQCGRGTLDCARPSHGRGPGGRTATMFDMTIEDGLFVDGTGSPGEHRDVGISEGRIVEIGPPGSLGKSKRPIDATGRVVSPGFIDVHTHLRRPGLLGPLSLAFVTPRSDHGDRRKLWVSIAPSAIRTTATSSACWPRWRPFRPPPSKWAPHGNGARSRSTSTPSRRRGRR